MEIYIHQIDYLLLLECTLFRPACQTSSYLIKIDRRLINKPRRKTD